MNEFTCKEQKAVSYYIRHPECSYAIFMISEAGDLSINSDYGISVFAWRSTGEDQTITGIKKFLMGLNESYWKGKMQYNLNYMGAKKSNINAFLDHVWPAFKEFQQFLKVELNEQA